MTDQSAESAKLTDDLISSVRACKSMDLIDYYKLKSVKKADEIVRSVHKHRFERFGSYLQYSARLFEKFLFVRLCDVAVPMSYRDAGNIKQFLNA